MMEKYTELQKCVHGIQNSGKSNKNSFSLSSLRGKHHTMQVEENPAASNSVESKSHTNPSEEFDNQDVIFF